MNWVFDTYSNLYTTAMMQTNERPHNVAPAKERTNVRMSAIRRLLGRQ